MHRVYRRYTASVKMHQQMLFSIYLVASCIISLKNFSDAVTMLSNGFNLFFFLDLPLSALCFIVTYLFFENCNNKLNTLLE